MLNFIVNWWSNERVVVFRLCFFAIIVHAWRIYATSITNHLKQGVGTCTNLITDAKLAAHLLVLHSQLMNYKISLVHNCLMCA